jgi:hypothetical protein
MVEADGHFAIKYNEFKIKSETRKRSRSNSVFLKFNLAQRSYDKHNSLSCRPIMEKIALFYSLIYVPIQYKFPKLLLSKVQSN